MKIEKGIYLKYLEECEKGKKLSKHTVKAYKIDLKQFEEFINKEEDGINKVNIMSYVFCLNNKYQPKTAKRKLASLHAFFEYLEFDGMIEGNPMTKIRYHIKQEKKLPRVIEQSDLCAIYKVLYAKKNKKAKSFSRDVAIIEVLLSTGIRVSELCSLCIKDVKLEEKYIRVYGKGSKERMIYLGNPNVLMMLKQYKLKFRSEAAESDFFFINKFGDPITDQGVRNMIKLYTKKAGIADNITPHMFRHTFATMLLEEDVDIRYIQNILGHSSISTTQIYTHISSNKQKEILINKNPRNRVFV